jgi:hypothetical protein
MVIHTYNSSLSGAVGRRDYEFKASLSKKAPVSKTNKKGLREKGKENDRE